MLTLEKILIFIICFNFFFSFIILDENSKESNKNIKKKTLTFEEFDQLMSNSEFSNAWKKYRKKFKYGETEDLLEEPIEDNYLEENINKATFSDLNDESESCLLPKEETSKILKDELQIEDNDPSDDVRFIFGRCNPIILVPGMLSTKLQVKVYCKNLYEKEQDIFKKMRFYCEDNICNSPNMEVDEHNLFIVALGAFQLIYNGTENKYSACVGYFLTFFNSKKACSPIDEENDQYACQYSENIKIGYYGYKTVDQDDAKCGLNAIQNVIMSEIKPLEKTINEGMLRSYGPLIERLEKKGYKPGFSLAGIPNDYRQFLANNKFTMEAFRYQVERLYENTGKKVVLIGHSFGTITLYNSLVNKNNKGILYKIKKFIAVGPTFAGSSQLIDVFFKSGDRYSTSINVGGGVVSAGYDDFGFGFIINKLPTAIELRPLPILGNLFTKPGYEIFSDAIKERFFLEKECGHKKCDDYLLNKYSTRFNALFKDYFPLLTDDDCKYESNLDESNNLYNRKCLMEMRNIFDCPMIIEETPDNNNKLPTDFDAYCGRIEPNLFYQKDCDGSNKQCLDQLYSKHVKYPFKEPNEKIDWFINNWNDENYTQKYGEMDSNIFDSEETYRTQTQKQIEYYEKISITKDLPVPHVDVDIVYSSYKQSVAAFIVDKNNWNENIEELYKAGDGVVPNWSAIIPGLKWAFDTKKYNLKNKIRLIEFCSRLGKDSKYKYDPLNKDQKFAAISCNCIDSNNLYKSGDCGHAVMISDSAFYEYLDSVINDPTEGIGDINAKNHSYSIYNSSFDYESQCNSDYLNILEKSMDNSTSVDN